MITAASSGSNAGSAVAAVFIILISIVFYFVPTIVALARRGEANTGGVVVLNFFLGWTGIGWVIALVMACRTVTRQPVYYAPPPGWTPPGPPTAGE
ncbi:MAG TPA: superinfection immunity protein [Streptosporangiaceae bacterium]|nr:superinfection immunity protein [Streptosporangiaceae bacterium]